jgi:sugar (pentulose or hexulose) kinase
VPLGSWVGSVLSGAIPRVDPTLANRMFLVDARSGAWSPALLAAFGLATHVLPRLVPTVDDHGALPWPGGATVPWTALVGDQQAAYVGAVGPQSERLVLNVGTAGFAMRAGRRDEPLPPGGRRAPLWTSRVRHEPAAWLIEVPVVPPAEGGLAAQTVDGAARELARRVALGDAAPAEFARRVAEALRALSGPAQQTVAVTGGGVGSPQLLALLARAFGGVLAVARQPEATLLGTARLAAAGAKVPWSLPPGGGYAPFPAD